jgi:hypothetical protein
MPRFNSMAVHMEAASLGRHASRQLNGCTHSRIAWHLMSRISSMAVNTAAARLARYASLRLSYCM